MVESTKDLLSRALKLPPVERMRLAHELLESVDQDDIGEFTPEWRAEIRRRVQEALAGEGASEEDWRVVLARIRQRGANQSA
jgi:putative addiction module component (TIGR02574 family)